MRLFGFQYLYFVLDTIVDLWITFRFVGMPAAANYVHTPHRLPINLLQ